MEAKKFVHSFDEGDGKNKKLLGGKGANLCEMTQMGLPVPRGLSLQPRPVSLTLKTRKRAFVPSLPNRFVRP